MSILVPMRSGVTCCLRFPGQLNCDLRKIAVGLFCSSFNDRGRLLAIALFVFRLLLTVRVALAAMTGIHVESGVYLGTCMYVCSKMYVSRVWGTFPGTVLWILFFASYCVLFGLFFETFLGNS